MGERRWSWHPDVADPERYARISQDHSGIHLDETLAREHGLPGVILHGMHVFGRVVSHLENELPAGESLHSVSVRFADVSLPGEDIEVRHWDEDGRSCFEAAQAGRPVLTAGRAEVGPQQPDRAPRQVWT